MPERRQQVVAVHVLRSTSMTGKTWEAPRYRFRRAVARGFTGLRTSRRLQTVVSTTIAQSRLSTMMKWMHLGPEDNRTTDTQEALEHPLCSRPVLFQNAVPAYPFSIGGTAFIVKFRNRHFVIPVKHFLNMGGFQPEQFRPYGAFSPFFAQKIRGAALVFSLTSGPWPVGFAPRTISDDAVALKISERRYSLTVTS
jgi:hypothetical protein